MFWSFEVGRVDEQRMDCIYLVMGLKESMNKFEAASLLVIGDGGIRGRWQ